MTSANAVLWRRLRYMLTPQFDIYQNLRKRLSVPSVLEVGFGTGFGVMQYADAIGYRIDGLELDRDAVDFAKTSLPIPKVTWIHGDILTWRPAFEYGAVVMIEVLEHIEAWEIALRNVRDALLPEGILIISHRNTNADLRKNDLHEREWSALELDINLHRFFRDVTLLDYTLDRVLDNTTRQTPLIAVARR